MPSPTIEGTAARLALLLTYAGGAPADPDRHDLVFEEHIDLRPLARASTPSEVWAIDGGQAVVADARCLALVVTRAARVLWRDGSCVIEEEGELRPQLIGCGEERMAVVAYGMPVRPDATIDIGLLRDWGEWQAVSRTVDEAQPGALVLVDGDLQPDWRIPPSYLAALLDRAATRGVTLAGVTKHSSLARGGAPLLGQLEREAEAQLGDRAMWWAKVAWTRPTPDRTGSDGRSPDPGAPDGPDGRQQGRDGADHPGGPDGADDRYGPVGPDDRYGPVGPDDRYGPVGPDDRYGPVGPDDRYGPVGPDDRYGPVGPDDRYGPVGPAGFDGRGRGRQQGPALQILAARLDPDARFSFRVDLPAGADAETVLGALSSIADDAGFPGYPYPLSVADRLAACPGWVRDDVWSRLEDGLDLAGVPLDVRERAFTDRHRLMERA